jgi:hypothetical protein
MITNCIAINVNQRTDGLMDGNRGTCEKTVAPPNAHVKAFLYHEPLTNWFTLFFQPHNGFCYTTQTIGDFQHPYTLEQTGLLVPIVQ